MTESVYFTFLKSLFFVRLSKILRELTFSKIFFRFSSATLVYCYGGLLFHFI